MRVFDCGFSGSNKDVIRLSGDLDRGWRNLGPAWGFDESDSALEYGESKFRCRLWLVAKAPTSFESRKTFHERYLQQPVRLGCSAVSLHGMRIEVDVPLDQAWSATKDLNKYPIVYAIREDVFSIETGEGRINYRLQFWVVLHGPSRMFVPNQYETGDGFAWVGGRPESNRQRF